MGPEATFVPLSMFIGDEHDDYKSMLPDYEMLDDIKAGDRIIKERGIIYLPKLTGMNPTEYKAYKDRAYFYGATARTITGLTGCITRRQADVEVPEKIKDFFDPFSVDGLSFEEVLNSTAEGLLSFGRHGILTDLAETGGRQRVYVTEYPAISILNWRSELINGTYKLTFLALSEVSEETDPDDPFATTEYEQIRTLRLDSQGNVVVNLYQRENLTTHLNSRKQPTPNWMQIDVVDGVKEHYPKKLGGNKLTEIPFVFFGSNRNGPQPNKPPLLDLANVNMSHWKLNADYFHGLHYCALPTPYALGLQKKEKFTIGPTVAIVDMNENAKIGMLEFTGQGLASVRDALNDMERKMAVLGARFLEEAKRSREVAAAMEIRASADNATLTQIARNLDHGFEHVVDYMMEWMNITGDRKIRTNKDFVPSSMSAKEITALLQAVQSGKLSTDSFLYQLKAGEIIPDSISIEEEKKMIEKELQEKARNNPQPVGEGLKEGAESDNEDDEEDEEGGDELEGEDNSKE